MMHNMIMGNLDGDLEKIAFDPTEIKQILNRQKVNAVVTGDNAELFLEVDGAVIPVVQSGNRKVHPFFIILHSMEAFNVSDYQVLFDVHAVPDDFVRGLDVNGQEHLCRSHQPSDVVPQALSVEGEGGLEEIDELKNMIKNLKNNRFFEALTTEFSGKLKDIARELIDFRQDLHKRIEPEIVEIAERDIPEASNQLEGINETLEKNTMKIMDINDEQMETANRQLEEIRAVLEGPGSEGDTVDLDRSAAIRIIEEIREQAPRLPEEAGQVISFLMPDMEKGLEMLRSKAGGEELKALMTEPIATVKDLVVDFGDGEECMARLAELGSEFEGLLSGCNGLQEGGNGGKVAETLSLEEALDLIQRNKNALNKVSSLSLSMMEPLSFQDLVGQRIQRIIKLVKTMETRIEDLIISFGIKLQRHREDPSRSFEDLDRDVEVYKSELKGPQREGDGLEQDDIDALLDSL
jgi:chemotaxis regulatin CheY-phosphate phosphatase CheZ